MANVRELSFKSREDEQAKDADKLEPKRCMDRMIVYSRQSQEQQVHREIDRA